MRNYKFIIGTLIGIAGLYLAYLAFSPIISFGKNETKNQKSGIFLRNSGNGPAIVKKVSFSLVGRTYGSGTIEDWGNIVLMTDNLGHDWLKYTAVLPDATIKAGDQIYLFYADKFDPESHRQLSCLMRNIEITIDYKDNIIGFPVKERFIPKIENTQNFEMECKFFLK